MKKAAQIILLIAGILAVVAAFSYFVLSAFRFAAAGFYVCIANGTISSVSDVPQTVWDILDALYGGHVTTASDAASLLPTYFAYAVGYIIVAILCIPAAVVCFMAKNQHKQGLYIACIVFGVFSTTILPIVGGVFGLIALGQEKKAAEAKPEEAAPVEEPKVVDAKVEEVPAEEPKAEN